MNLVVIKSLFLGFSAEHFSFSQWQAGKSIFFYSPIIIIVAAASATARCHSTAVAALAHTHKRRRT